jgi:hypothetical protein
LIKQALRQALTHIPLVGGQLPSVSMLTAGSQRKHLPEWFRSRRENYLLDEAQPWFTFDAIDFLKANLRQGLRVFEYGCGGSTLFWLRYGAKVVSIEHEPMWHSLLKQRLSPKNRHEAHDSADDRLDLRLVPPDETHFAAGHSDFVDPGSYRTHTLNLETATFYSYVTQIDAFPDSYFDVVLVDGQARPSCIKHAYPKVKPGGMLILDNADVPEYLAQTRQFLAGFEAHHFYGIGPIWGVMWQTDIYVAR